MHQSKNLLHSYEFCTYLSNAHFANLITTQ
jgi:hypothetical protein